jgi:hypothetical protein
MIAEDYSNTLSPTPSRSSEQGHRINRHEELSEQGSPLPRSPTYYLYYILEADDEEMISLRGIVPGNKLDPFYVPTNITVDHTTTQRPKKRTLVEKRIEFWQNRAVSHSISTTQGRR